MSDDTPNDPAASARREQRKLRLEQTIASVTARLGGARSRVAALEKTLAELEAQLAEDLAE